MAVIILLFFLISFEIANARIFIFGASTRISQLSNWLNADYPCQGDTIIFEENKKTVTFLDQSIQVTSIILPQVGSLIFSDDSVLGEKSRWQCTRRKSPEKVFFQSNAVFAAFSDPASWLLDKRPLLHMNQVPGANDDVVFRDMGAFQIFIDDQVTVNTLRISQDW
ncbi:Cytosolic phospholipase A2 zeta [Parelaphostrongylus tenuis]|uniref:Protein amnionless n=1 Tax=Parelaphostrongylus tenuis TaxID=148309 RepID=A0AAD5MV53_PARTN|nr:Cytosolic phospholipase A2 zeta [Parelaphostrongylus tenuis]